jgi:catechol 2,3-dioxygenase-like lactoylglutathione lyase family enzyme
MGLQKFEGRLERIVDGTFSKAFRGELHPVEIGRRLTREMDLKRRLGVHGLIAPNSYVVYLSPSEFERFESFLDALVRELEEAAREHARNEDYVFVGPVTVSAVEDPGLRRGRFEIESEVHEGPAGLTAASIVLADGERIVLGPEPITIGRLPESSVVVSDPNASRRHAEIRRAGNDVVVIDLDSTNGTRVNGAPIRERILVDGDEIVVGTTFIRFETS